MLNSVYIEGLYGLYNYMLDFTQGEDKRLKIKGIRGRFSDPLLGSGSRTEAPNETTPGSVYPRRKG